MTSMLKRNPFLFAGRPQTFVVRILMILLGMISKIQKYNFLRACNKILCYLWYDVKDILFKIEKFRMIEDIQ